VVKTYQQQLNEQNVQLAALLKFDTRTRPSRGAEKKNQDKKEKFLVFIGICSGLDHITNPLETFVLFHKMDPMDLQCFNSWHYNLINELLRTL